MQPFAPAKASTVNISATTSSGRVKLGGQPVDGPFQLRIHNAGSATVFLAFGDDTVAAVVATGMPVPAGAIEVITIPNPGSVTRYAAAITAAGTATVYFTMGQGY